ncbi:MAG: tyrosine--tRNA ligase [Acidobacteriia bacterium]|nr:tyrosine--tRNA ligase [Terriglobia bacterium]
MAKIPVEEQVRAIMFGAEFGDPALRNKMGEELRDKLIEAEKTGKPLRVYAGYDPSKPDLHLGHSITLRKLRQFQDFGQDVTFLVGTFTAQVGDTSDKTKGRPRLTEEQVLEAAKTYAEQAFKILDPEKTTVDYNHKWLSPLTMADVVSLASNFTVQQFLERDNYRQRIAAGNPVGLHEFLYALLQGYDAVHLKADVQIGATEQLFNILAGRKLQEAHGLRPSTCITYPILVGTDGQRRMSKSSENYVGLAEPPNEQYGKTMSISDETMLEWIKYVTRWSVPEIEERTRKFKSGEVHPMELKKSLAFEVVSMYHGDEAARQAQKHFETVHQERQDPEAAPVLKIDKPITLIELVAKVEGVASKAEARRLINEGGVKVDKQVIKEYNHIVKENCLVQVGKRRFARIQLNGA